MTVISIIPEAIQIALYSKDVLKKVPIKAPPIKERIMAVNAINFFMDS